MVFKMFSCKYNIEGNISEFISCAQTGPLDWSGLTLALGIKSQFIFFRGFSKVSEVDLDVFYKCVVRVKVIFSVGA